MRKKDEMEEKRWMKITEKMERGTGKEKEK